MNAVPHVSGRVGDPAEWNRQLVVRIESSQLFRDYRSAFETATGLPLAIRAAGCDQPSRAGSRRANPFCARMAERNERCAGCVGSQRVEQDAGGQSAPLECGAGLHDSLVPIRVGENVVAYLQTGQAMFRHPTERRFRAVRKHLEDQPRAGDAVELEGAFFRTRVVPRAAYEAMVRLLESFAEHLSLVSNELMLKVVAPEPPAVSKARAFVAEHIAQDLSLSDVARAVGISAFYFCKVFKAAVGLTFTDYLARTRVEKSKQMLLDPNVRISESAYAAGFQSLSQFNRVFRRVAGETPTQFRDNLHGTSARRSLGVAA